MRTLSELSPSARGRVLALLYLSVVAAGITAQVLIADRMIVGGDAARTAANIVAAPSLYRLAFTIFMVEMAAQATAIGMWYDLLKPVDRSVARTALILGLTGSGIKTMARLFFYVPLILLGGSSSLGAFSPAQLESLSLLFITINDQGAAIAVVFFGFESVLQGWLVFRSEFLPRTLGVISMIGGLGWLTWLWPPFGAQAIIVVALFAIVGVIATSGWLLIRGVDDERWSARAAGAAIPPRL